VSGDIDEKADVNTLGKILYTVLTGLYPYYEYYKDDDGAMEAAREGKSPYVDSRWRISKSLVERRLVEAMERCWPLDPSERSSIFDVIAYLRETRTLLYASVAPANVDADSKGQ